MELNYNIAMCMKQASSWGHTSFYNVCKGTKEIVPWGSMDWTSTLIGVGLFGAIVVSLTVIAAAGIAALYREWKLEREFNKPPF